MPCGCGGRKRLGQKRRRRSGRWGEPSMNVTGSFALRGRPAPTMLCFGTHGPRIRNRTPSPAELRTSDAALLDTLNSFGRMGPQNIHAVCILFRSSRRKMSAPLDQLLYHCYHVVSHVFDNFRVESYAQHAPPVYPLVQAPRVEGGALGSHGDNGRPRAFAQFKTGLQHNSSLMI